MSFFCSSELCEDLADCDEGDGGEGDRMFNAPTVTDSAVAALEATTQQQLKAVR
jgi:hypothetical protein